MQHTAGRYYQPIHAVLLSLALFAGCQPDTEARYGEFLDARADSLPTSGEGCAACSTCEFSGRYLMAVKTALGDAFLLFETTIDLRESDGSRVIDISMQPVKTDYVDEDQTIPRQDPRTPVGNPLLATGVPVVDGEFVADFGAIHIDEEANPLTPTPIETTCTLEGRVVASDGFCGDVLGTISVPLRNIPLEGATFAAIRYDGDLTELEAYPWSCASLCGQEDEADP